MNAFSFIVFISLIFTNFLSFVTNAHFRNHAVAQIMASGNFKRYFCRKKIVLLLTKGIMSTIFVLLKKKEILSLSSSVSEG